MIVFRFIRNRLNIFDTDASSEAAAIIEGVVPCIRALTIEESDEY